MFPASKLDKDGLLVKARSRTGLKDPGTGIWEEALDRLIASINAEACLSPVGRFMVREQLLGRLEQRFRAEYWFAKHPEILEQELYPVWLITGSQRTGTTFLQRLLAADPNTRSLLSWESMFPAPLSDGWLRKDRRLKRTQQAARALSLIKPGFHAIHPIEPLQPEEDVLLLDISFMSTSWEAMLHVPSFAGWLEKTDPTPAYAYEVKLLKLLQWQDKRRLALDAERELRKIPAGMNPDSRWILKSPHHLEWLEVVDQVFPAVKYIWTHREERECIPSFLSMLAHGRAMFSSHVDPEKFKAHWLRKNRLIKGNARRFRKENPKVVFQDISYKKMIKNPLEEIERIYASFGAECPVEEIKTALKREGDRRRPAKHIYRPSDFGL